MQVQEISSPNAELTATHDNTSCIGDIQRWIRPKLAVSGLARKGETDSEGNYQIAALPVGHYRVEVRATDFRIGIVEHLGIEVARIIVQDFRLACSSIFLRRLSGLMSVQTSLM